MFLLDDILLTPFKGLAWIFRELHRATNQEYANERDRLRLVGHFLGCLVVDFAENPENTAHREKEDVVDQQHGEFLAGAVR